MKLKFCEIDDSICVCTRDIGYQTDSSNKEHSMTYLLSGFMEIFFRKIQKSDPQQPPKFKQFLTILLYVYFRILAIFFVTNHYN